MITWNNHPFFYENGNFWIDIKYVREVKMASEATISYLNFLLKRFEEQKDFFERELRSMHASRIYD